MAIATILYDFEDHFRNGDYKKCAHLLTEYIDRINEVGITCVANQKCLKRLPDDCFSKCHFFLYWMIQQNIAISELMMHSIFIRKVDINYEVFRNKFILQILEIHSLPATKEHLSLEFIMLYNCLTTSLIHDTSSFHLWSDGTWKLINSSFARAQEILKPSQRKSSLLCQFSHNISFLKNMVFTNLSKLDKDILYYLCFAIGWLAALQDDDLVISAIIKIMTDLKELNNSQQLGKMENYKLKLFCPSEISSAFMFLTSDVHDLFAACLSVKQNDFASAIHSLNKLSVPEWKYVISYIKAFIYYKRCQWDRTVKCCIKFWEEQTNCENQLTSRFCNLLGCCYFIQNKLVESQKWFQIAIDHDGSFLLPMYNLSLVFLYLNETLTVTRILKSLSENIYSCLFQKLCHVSSYSCFAFKYFMLQYCPELIRFEADYYLAHHYVILGHYLDAAFIFEKLLLFLQQNKMQIFSAHNSERIPYFFCLLHVEGAYMFLRSNAYDKCIQICDSLQQIISVSSSKNIVLSDWILDSIPSLTNEKCFSIQRNCQIVLSETKEDDLASTRVENLKTIGNYFYNNSSRCVITEEEKILDNKFLCFAAYFIKALAVYKTSNIQEAIDVMSRLCDLSLDLLQDKTILHKNNKRLNHLANGTPSCPISNDSMNSPGMQDTPKPIMLACTLEEYISNAGSSIDEVPSVKSDDNYNFEASEKLSDVSDMLTDDDDIVKCQIHQNNNKCSITQKSCNLDEIIFLSEIYNNMAVFCITNDQLDRAEHYLKIASECMPDNIDVLYNCCLLELKKENFDVAQNLWKSTKQKIAVIESILSGNIVIFPYSVSLEQIQALNTLLSVNNNICVAFDVNWDD